MAEKASPTEQSEQLSQSKGVTRSKSDRRSFVDAAWDKFNGEMTVDDCIGIYVPKKGPAKLTDSGHLILPWRVHMNDCGITEAGQHADMTAMCHDVTELDLAHNNITSLQEVLQVIRCMPNLTFLNLTSNPLLSSTISPAARHPHPPSTAITDITISPATTTSLSDGYGPSDEDLSSSTPSEPGGNLLETAPLANKGINQGIGDSNANVEPPTAVTTTIPPGPDINSHSDETLQSTPIPPTLSSPDASGEDDEGGETITVSCGKPLTSADAFLTVRQLVLNDTGVDWQGIVVLLSLFPSLEELHLSINNYTTVDLPEDFVYPSLTHLFFNNSAVHRWSDISRLGRTFPHLQHLFLADTAITSVDDDGESLAKLFPRLTLLSLSKSKLCGWEQVDKLRLFPSLVDVRLQGVPFLEALGEKVRRQQLVARLPSVTRLNSSNVTDEERIDAERAFIRLFQDEEEKPDRYYELEQVYGKLDPLAKVSLVPQTIFNVNIIMNDHREPFELDARQTVRDLKKSLQNIAGLPSNKFSLYYICSITNTGADKLIYLDKKLYTYNLSDGDEFIIEPKTQ